MWAGHLPPPPPKKKFVLSSKNLTNTIFDVYHFTIHVITWTLQLPPEICLCHPPKSPLIPRKILTGCMPALFKPVLTYGLAYKVTMHAKFSYHCWTGFHRSAVFCALSFRSFEVSIDLDMTMIICLDLASILLLFFKLMCACDSRYQGGCE